jgi:hypothetical protein
VQMVRLPPDREADAAAAVESRSSKQTKDPAHGTRRERRPIASHRALEHRGSLVGLLRPHERSLKAESRPTTAGAGPAASRL